MRAVRILLGFIVIVSLTMGVWHLSHATWIYSKAYAATYLIADAWKATQTNGQIHRPWSWADTWPVGKLTIPAVGLSEIVLAGDSGATLAFGPGLSNAGVPLDSVGVKLISGHRDTHFSKLQNLAVNDEITIETAKGNRRYVVIDMSVVDSRLYTINSAAGDLLLLSTCYPFNSINTGGPERFVIRAREVV